MYYFILLPCFYCSENLHSLKFNYLWFTTEVIKFWHTCLKSCEKNYFLHKKKISCDQNPWRWNKHGRFCTLFWLMITDHFHPSYSRTGRVSWVLQSSVSMSLKIHSGSSDSGVFPNHKNKIFLQIHTNILTFPHWEKDSHQPATNRKERYRESEMCRLVISVDQDCEEWGIYQEKQIFIVYNIIICSLQ